VADRSQGSVVSRAEQREELLEVRANSFAAAFLLPEEGIRVFLRERGKGELSRSELQAYDGTVALAAQKRQEVQDIQVADVVAVAQHFGASYESTLYRLQNLKLLSDEERQTLTAQTPLANRLRWLLEPGAVEDTAPEPRSRYGLAFLALEAFRAEAISRGRFLELCALATVPREEVEGLIAAISNRRMKVAVPRKRQG
jgi:hypothetical protein